MSSRSFHFQKISRRMLSGLGLGILVFAGNAAIAPAWSQQNVIPIGIVSPNSGAAARYGTFAWRGARLAEDEINAAGGVLGRKIALVQGDSQCLPSEGVSVTQRMINEDHVGVIIGDVCSSVTIAMQPVAESSGTLLINAASSNPEITTKAGVGGYKWTYRNYPTDENRSLVVLQYAVEKRGFKKFAVLSVDSDYGRGAIALTKKYLSRFGAEIVSEDYYKDSEVDFHPILSKIRHSGAQAILMYGLSDTAPIVGRQMVETGLAGKVALAGSAEFNNPSTIKAAPTALNGAIEADAWISSYDNPRNKQFIAAYKAKYDGEMPNVHAYTYWETLNLVVEAIKEANSTNNEDIRKTLSSMTYDGAMGKVKFDDHNQAELPMILYEIDGDVPVIKGTFSSKIDYSAK